MESLRERKAEVERIAKNHGIVRVRVFGSVARGDQHEGSDLDLLVSVEPGRGLFSLIAFEQEVSQALGVSVHVLSDRGLAPAVGLRIVAEASPL